MPMTAQEEKEFEALRSLANLTKCRPIQKDGPGGPHVFHTQETILSETELEKVKKRMFQILNIK